MRRIRFEAVLAALILCIQLYAAFVPANSLMNGWFTSDDAFYYFKTAQNISEGHGITFDGLGRDSGFHPLWMAVLVPVFALARYDLILPLRLVIVISTLLAAGTALLIYRIAKRILHPTAAAFTALLWAFHPLVYSDIIQLGLEASICSFFIALLLYRLVTAPSQDGPDSTTGVNARWLLVTGLIGALTILARLDNVFLVAVAGAWLVIRPARMRYLVLMDTALIVLGVCWSYMTWVGFGAAYAPNQTSAMVLLVTAVAVRLVLYLFTGLYQRPQPGGKGLALYLAKAAGVSILATAVISGGMLGLNLLHFFSGFTRLILAYEAGASLAALLLTRLVAALITWWNTAPEEDFVWQPTLARLGYFFLPVAAILGTYMVASLAYYGTPMPVSGQVKRWWGTLITVYGRPVEDLAGLLGFFQRDAPWAMAVRILDWPQAIPASFRYLVYGEAILALVAEQPRRALQSARGLALYPLFIGSFIQIISYTGTGYVSLRPWYWSSQILLIVLLLGLLVDQFLYLVDRRSQTSGANGSVAKIGRAQLTRVANGLVMAIAGVVILSTALNMVDNLPWWVTPSNYEDYLGGIHALEENTEPGAIIGSTGGGVGAYFGQGRTIVNLDGLMNTYAYFRALQARKGGAYLDKLGLQYVYATEHVVTSSDPYYQYKDQLTKIKDLAGATLFRWNKKTAK